MADYPERKSTRLKSYDYSSNGYYFITICVKDVGKFRDNKQAVQDIFLSLSERFNGLSIDYYVFMQDHIHAILVLEDSPISLSEIVRQFKAIVSFRFKGKGFWQRGYYEHVIRNEKALYKIREYIQNNPLMDKLMLEQFY